MRLLYHFPLHPASRKVRLVLGEKNLPFETQVERAWDPHDGLVALDPSGEVPILVEEDGGPLADAGAICEYLDEAYPEPPLIGTERKARAEVRRLAGWFDGKFQREVTVNLLDEKLFKRLAGRGVPDSQAVRKGYANLHRHLEYIAWLTDRRRWLAGDDFSLADIAAAAHVSAIDYLGDVPWDGHDGAKDWYARVKSRPSFRPLLIDIIAGAPPAAHYPILDF